MIPAGIAVVRFRTERFGGHVAMHCHVNSHSDTGIMAVANIEGGQGPNEDPTALAAGTCGYATIFYHTPKYVFILTKRLRNDFRCFMI